MGVKTLVMPHCNSSPLERKYVSSQNRKGEQAQGSASPSGCRAGRKRSINHVVRLSLSSLRAASTRSSSVQKPEQRAASSARVPLLSEVVIITSSEDETPGFSRPRCPRDYFDARVNLTPESPPPDQVCFVDISTRYPGGDDSSREASTPPSDFATTSAKKTSLKRKRERRQPLRHRSSKRRSGEPAITRTISPSIGEERYRNVPTLNNGVEIRESTIPSAGRGLFASRSFRRGELVTEYVGEIITRDEARRRLRRGQFHYLGTLVTGMYEIDGIQHPQDKVGAASFINHARKPHANVQWAHVEDRRACFRRLFAKACRDIAPGEELFLDYGKTYWEHHRRWRLALEKGKDALSDETLTDDEAECISALDSDAAASKEIHIIDSDEENAEGDGYKTSSSFRVDVSTTGGDDDYSTSSNQFLSQFANEFHLRPCEPPPRSAGITSP